MAAVYNRARGCLASFAIRSSPMENGNTSHNHGHNLDWRLALGLASRNGATMLLGFPNQLLDDSFSFIGGIQA